MVEINGIVEINRNKLDCCTLALRDKNVPGRDDTPPAGLVRQMRLEKIDNPAEGPQQVTTTNPL